MLFIYLELFIYLFGAVLSSLKIVLFSEPSMIKMELFVLFQCVISRTVYRIGPVYRIGWCIDEGVCQRISLVNRPLAIVNK